MKLTMSSISIDSYQKLKSGESFLKLKEFQDEVINPITMNFFINTESENYFLKAVMCFVNISLGTQIHNFREENPNRATNRGPALEAIHQNEEILGHASNNPKLGSDRQASDSHSVM